MIIFCNNPYGVVNKDVVTAILIWVKMPTPFSTKQQSHTAKHPTSDWRATLKQGCNIGIE